MSKAISEHTLEVAIVADLVKGHHVQCLSSAFNKALCLDPGPLIDFIQTTQPKEWAKFVQPTVPGTFSMRNLFHARRLVGRAKAWLAVGACLDQLYILPVGLSVLQSAARSGDGDFEDHLQVASSVAANLDAIVTRDPAGFRNSPITILTPAQLIDQLTPSASGNA